LISENKEWILLFDNADDPNLDLFPFFPACAHGNIIITSRNPQLAAYGPDSHSKIGDMDEPNAIDLLLQRAVKEKTIQNRHLASEIVKVCWLFIHRHSLIGLVQELSCLPLAIIQAGAYILRFKCLNSYLSIYKENYAKLLNQHPTQSHADYRRTVYTTWQISFSRLSKVSARFLQLCSLLHHSNIEVKIFEQAAKWIIRNDRKDSESETFHLAKQFLNNFVSNSGVWDQQQLMNTCAEIEAFSLIEKDEATNMLSMHPLVHLW
jgi:hypothetical protein